MGPALQLGSPAYYAAAAMAARASLALLRAGEPLLWRPEVTTPLNSLLGVREGLRLLQLGLSPYAGAACHAPPLVLALHAATAAHPVLYLLPNAAADALAALALWRTAAVLLRGRSAEAAGAVRSAEAGASAQGQSVLQTCGRERARGPSCELAPTPSQPSRPRLPSRPARPQACCLDRQPWRPPTCGTHSA